MSVAELPFPPTLYQIGRYSMNIYLKRYNALISHYQCQIVTGYMERHHIVPRCMDGSDDKSNIVELPPKAHYIAHLLLTKAYPDNPKLQYAIVAMSMDRYAHKKFTAAQYDKIRRARMATSRRPRGPLPENHKAAISAARKGMRISPETKAKMSAVRKGKKRSEEVKAKISASKKGKPPSEKHRLGMQRRDALAPIVTCSYCGHQQKRGPNFYKNHETRCKSHKTSAKTSHAS